MNEYNEAEPSPTERSDQAPTLAMYTATIILVIASCLTLAAIVMSKLPTEGDALVRIEFSTIVLQPGFDL